MFQFTDHVNMLCYKTKGVKVAMHLRLQVHKVCLSADLKMGKSILSYAGGPDEMASILKSRQASIVIDRRWCDSRGRIRDVQYGLKTKKGL